MTTNGVSNLGQHWLLYIPEDTSIVKSNINNWNTKYGNGSAHDLWCLSDISVMRDPRKNIFVDLYFKFNSFHLKMQFENSICKFLVSYSGLYGLRIITFTVCIFINARELCKESSIKVLFDIYRHRDGSNNSIDLHLSSKLKLRC